jgi:non-specific serine/threonine protein kinase
MAKLNTTCPYCSKQAHEIGRDTIGGEVYILLECGHTLIRTIQEAKQLGIDDIVSSDGRHPFPYQIDGVKFLESAECNGLLLDEQGLGKTVQECILLSRNEWLFPALIVVKSGLRAQWFAEMYRWAGIAAQVITGSREQPLFEYFRVVIVSIDSLRLLRPDVKVLSEYEKQQRRASGRRVPNDKPVWSDETCAQFRHIAIDESQKIKNDGASRTKALYKIATAWERVAGGKRPAIVCMSGTNIEKHAGEFFVTLNLTRPEMFYSKAVFINQECEIHDGRIGGLKDPARFKERTKDFILRRTRDQVLPDLPKVFRQFRLAELEGGEKEAYIKIVKEFQKDFDADKLTNPTDILGYLSRMRHITGIAKVKACVEFVEEFLLESDRKLVIFLHHQMAGAILMAKLQRLCMYGDADLAMADEQLSLPAMQIFNPPLYLSSDLNALTERPALVEKFKEPGNRILIASTLASAEGLNMQFCSDCLIMERQWNPSIEEQAESRFPRPGSTADKINAHYLIAAGTVDDFLTEIVEGKRRNVKQTLDGEEMVWDEKNLIMELARTLSEKGLKKWGLR